MLTSAYTRALLLAVEPGMASLGVALGRGGVVPSTAAAAGLLATGWKEVHRLTGMMLLVVMVVEMGVMTSARRLTWVLGGGGGCWHCGAGGGARRPADVLAARIHKARMSEWRSPLNSLLGSM